MGVVISITAMVYSKDTLLQWWQYITFLYIISVILLLPFFWILTCAALTKVATDLADDMEKVRNKKYGYLEFDEV
jgi:DMSO reductase anchor subunit